MKHDSAQLLEWKSSETNKSGLEVVLEIIDRLLSPTVDDNAAAEVGGLAAAVVVHVGSERLGSYLMPLLQAVAQRVATAERSTLIQSLIMVFARLCLASPKDVVDFLTQVEVKHDGGYTETGLQVVMTKWLDSSSSFAGYEDLWINATALCKLYELHDERLANLMVRGDIVVPPSDRIVTRSRAKAEPDRWTSISIPLKVMKLLVDEVGAGGADADGAGLGINGAVNEAKANGVGHDSDDDDDDDGEWEDDDDDFGGLGKEDILRFANASPHGSRHVDNELQAHLANWFRGLAGDSRFMEDYERLNTGEQERLRMLG